MTKPCPPVALATLLFASAAVNAQAPEKTHNPDYSKEAFVVEQYNHKFKVENDGTLVEEESSRVRVQSDAGVQRYGLLAFSYASGAGTMDIEYVRVHKPDGSTVETPQDTIQDTAAEITRQAPFYSDVREKHVPVKGLGVGDTIEYKCVWHVTHPVTPRQFELEYGFVHDAILFDQQLEVSVPKERTLKYESPNHPPVITERGAYRVYTWSASNLELKNKDDKAQQIKDAGDQARGRNPQPDVKLTSFQSWEEVGRWYSDLQNDRVKPTSEIQAKASELTKNALDDDAKIRAIYNYVSTQFRYIGVAFGVGRYQPHFAAEVLANQYGDCKDKHTLLAALLNAAGIKAYPALISTQRETDADLPSPYEFNHVITVVPRAGGLTWLDTTAEVGPFRYLVSSLRDKHALVIWDDKPASLAATPADLPFPFLQNFQMTATLDDNGKLQGNAEFSVRGDLEVVLRAAFRQVPMPQWKDLAQRVSQNLGFAGDVSEVTASSPEKTDEPFHFSYKYVRKDYGDWQNHRIVTPAPFILLPAMAADLKIMEAPLWLGAPLEINFHTQLELPKGYIPQIPEAIHAKNDFADFDATYLFKNGRLISERHLRTKMTELSPAAFAKYKTFCKTVEDDYEAFIPLSSVNSMPKGAIQAVAPPPRLQPNLLLSSLPTLPDSSDQQAMRLEKDAREAVGRNDAQNAISLLYRATAADPKFVRAWVTLGQFLMMQQQTDSALDAFQKAVAVDPSDPVPHRIYAISLMVSGEPEESASAWKEYIKVTPENPDGYVGLGNVLLKLKRYDDAAQSFDSAAKLDPARANIQYQLGLAYLNAGKEEKATPPLRRALELIPDPTFLNQSAYEIAESGKGLPIALEYSQGAVNQLETASTHLDLDTLDPEDEDLTVKLASAWTTFGFIQDRMGKAAEAEKTLTAAWKLTQDGVAATRLCELYDSQHKTQAAIQMCRFAKNRLPSAVLPSVPAVLALLNENDARLERLSPGSTKSPHMGTIDAITSARDFKLPRVAPGTLSAQFYVLLKLDEASGHFKVQDAKYISGSEKLKPYAKTLNHLNVNFSSPDGKPASVIRRGTFLCADYSGCEFMLLDAAAGHPIQFNIANTTHN